MLLASRTRIRTALLPPLLALCVVCLWPPAHAHADSVKIKLIVLALDASAPNALPRPVSGAEISLPRTGFDPVTGKTEEGHFEVADRDFNLDKQDSYELTVKAAGFEEKKIKITAEDLREAAGKELTVFALLTKPGHSPAGGVVFDQGNKNAGANANTNANAGKAINNQNGNSNANVSGGESPGLFTSVWNTGAWFVTNGVWWLGLLLLAFVAGIIVAWRHYGVRPSFVRPSPQSPTAPNTDGAGAKETSGGQAEILDHFVSINRSLTEMARRQNETYMLVESLPSKINKVPVPVAPVGITQDAPAITTSGRAVAGARTTQGVSQSGEQPAQQAGAVGAYRSLVGGRGSGIEPVYLNAENKGSLSDRFEDEYVYLCEVGHTQGTFVLFPEGDKSGWVFPNPGLMFRAQALKPVFPLLTESEFNERKDGIKPRPASKVGEGRWKLEGS